MLSLDEIKNLARLRRLKPYQEEKRYVQTAALSSIYLRFGNNLLFKGGTALFLLYGLPRFSEDLDFTALGEVNVEDFNGIARDLSLLGMESTVKEKKSVAGTTLLLSAKGPLYTTPISICTVTLDISERKDAGKGTPLIFRTDYRDILPFAINTMGLEEICAEKIRAVMKRNYARDIFDLHFLLRIKGAEPTLESINKKMDYYDEQFSFAEFKERVSVKKSLWEPELRNMVIGELPSFDVVAKETIETLTEILH